MSDVNLPDDIDFDDIDDLDLDFEVDDAEEERTIIEQLKDGAIEELQQEDFQADVVRNLLKHALPDGYEVGIDTLSDVKREASSLYDEAKSTLKDPINDIRKELAASLNDIGDNPLGYDFGKIGEMLMPDEAETENRSVTKYDPEESAIVSTLNAIFERDVVENEQQLEVKKVEQALGANSEYGTIYELKKLTAFQDTVEFDWMRKTLELQQRQFFLGREQLAVTKAAAVDLKSGFEAVVKNTSLPDIVKSTMSEEYSDQLEERIFGKVNEKSSEFFGNFGSRLKENITSRAQALISGAIDLSDPITQGASVVNEQDEISAAELAGSMGIGELGEGLSTKIGEMVANFLNKNPAVKKYGEEIAFLAQNYPTELADAIDSWDGKVFSDKAIERFPILDNVGSQVLAEELRALIPRPEDIELRVASNLEGTKGMEARQYDEISRKSVVEIIPGFLSRILEQATIANMGPGNVERIVYDTKSESFEKMSTVVDRAINTVQGTNNATREENRLEVSRKLGNGSVLHEGVADSILEVARLLSEQGKVINRDNIENFATENFGRQKAGGVNRALANANVDDNELVNIFKDLAYRQESGAEKEIITKTALRRIGPDKLSTDAQRGFERWMDESATAGLRPRQENLEEELERIGGFSQDTIDEMTAFLLKSEKTKREIDGVFAEAGRRIGDVYHGQQEQINRLYGLGQKDVLIEAGIVKQDGRGVSSVGDVFKARGRDDTTAKDEIFSAEEVARPKAPLLETETNTLEETLSNQEQPRFEMPDFNMASPFEFFEQFTIEREAGKGVPVYQLDLPGDKETSNPDELIARNQERIIELVERGFITTSELLDLIYRKDITVEMPEQPGFWGELIRGGSSVISSGSNLLAKYTEGVYNLSSVGLGAAGNIVSSGIGGIANIAAGAAGGLTGKTHGKDIYLEGEKEPIIKARDLRKGRYFDAESGDPIKNIKDIRGDVIDADGNIILSAEDLRTKGIFDRDGINLSNLTGMIGDAIGGLGNIYSGMTALGLDVAKKIVMTPVRALNKAMDRPKDVYISGEDTPVLSAIIMKNGGYFSETTNKVIRKPMDIDGPVRDRDNNIILTNDDILRGLVDVNGIPIDANKAIQLARRSIQLAGKVVVGGFKAAKSVVDAGINTGMAITKGGLNVAKGAIDVFTGKARLETADSADSILQNILDFMMVRWPLESADETDALLMRQAEAMESISRKAEAAKEKKIAGDLDGDGDRDNSLSDIIGRRDIADTATPETAREVEEKETNKSPALFGLLSTMASTLSGGFSSAIDLLTGMGTSLMGILAATKARTALGGADDIDLGGDDVDRDKRKGGRKGGKRGLFGKIVQGAKSAAGKASALLGTGGRMVAKKVAQRGLVAGAGAVAAGTVAAPAIAIAGAAWGAWELGTYFFNRSKAEPLEALRFLQYGVNYKTTDDIAKIRILENEIEDYVTVSRGKLNLKVKNQVAVDEFVEIFGVDPSNAADVDAWLLWFNQRFIPVYMSHRVSLHGINPDIDVTDVDDEIDDDDIMRYLAEISLCDAKIRKSKATVISRTMGPMVTAEVAWNYLEGLLAKYDDKKPLVVDSNKRDPSSGEGRITIAQRKQESRTTKTPMNSDDTQNRVGSVREVVSPAGRPRPMAASGQVKSSDEAAEKGTLRLIRPTTGRVTSPYGYRMVSGKKKMHNGIDYADRQGAPIWAAAAGVIVRHGYSDSYGKVVYIKHFNGWCTRYAHMHTLANLKVGDKVEAGAVIGTQGNTGKSRGVHLHFELREGYGNNHPTHDPLKFMVAGAKETAAIKQEEKEIVDESKATMGNTIEGIDTIKTVAQARAGMPQSILTDNATPSTGGNPTAGEMPRESIDSKVLDQKAKIQTLEQLNSINQTSEKNANRQTAALEKLVKSQTTMVEILREISKGVSTPAQVTVTSTSGDQPIVSQSAPVKETVNKPAIKPVVKTNHDPVLRLDR